MILINLHCELRERVLPPLRRRERIREISTAILLHREISLYVFLFLINFLVNILLSYLLYYFVFMNFSLLYNYLRMLFFESDLLDYLRILIGKLFTLDNLKFINAKKNKIRFLIFMMEKCNSPIFIHSFIRTSFWSICWPNINTISTQCSLDAFLNHIHSNILPSGIS